MNQKGLVGSEYPAWTMRVHVEDLKESIAHKQRQIKSNVVDAVNMPYFKEELAKETKRLAEIGASKPMLTDAQKSRVEAEYLKLSNTIQATMFTREQEKRGLVDAHEEARRMTTPIISVDKEVAKACNVTVTGDKVSRNGAIKMFKILGHFIGAQTNAEALRKEA